MRCSMISGVCRVHIKYWSENEGLMKYYGSGASADNSPSSHTDACPVTLVSDGKQPETRHLCFAACRSSVHERAFCDLKSPDAPELISSRPQLAMKGSGTMLRLEKRSRTRSRTPAYFRGCCDRLHIGAASPSEPSQSASETVREFWALSRRINVSRHLYAARNLLNPSGKAV